MLLLLCLVSCRDLNYIYNEQTTAFYKCYKEKGYNQVLLFIDSNPTGIDAKSVQNVINAKNAELSV